MDEARDLVAGSQVGEPTGDPAHRPLSDAARHPFAAARAVATTAAARRASATPDWPHPRAGAVSPALVVDLYELTMAEAFLRAGMHGTATFSLTIRRLPPERGYLIAAGLEPALDYLQSLRFEAADIEYLRGAGLFSSELLTYLSTMRFTGEVRAVAEGRALFAEEPLIEVTAPLIEAQIVETALINILHLHTLLASKAIRCVEAAAGRSVVDFGLRRAHGIDAGMAAARSAYLAGCAATSNVAAGQRYGVPITGTMAHSFVLAFPTELAAFRAYADCYPESTTLLIDTYDTLDGARNAVTVGQELARRGQRLRAVRLDSGEIGPLSRRVRELLDAGDLTHVQIIASGGLDEYRIEQLVDARSPIDAFGVGTRMDASEDAPTLEAAYKLVEYDGAPVRKLSTGKVSWAGRKQVWRQGGPDGVYRGDLVTTADEEGSDAEPLLDVVMRAGQRVLPSEPLTVIRERCSTERQRLPTGVRRLAAHDRYPVSFSAGLRAVQDGRSSSPD